MVTPVVEQGDLLRVGGIRWPVIVVSNNFFNESGRVVACPILPDAVEGPLHIRLKDCPVEGYVLCEQMRYIDLKARRCPGSPLRTTSTSWTFQTPSWVSSTGSSCKTLGQGECLRENITEALLLSLDFTGFTVYTEKQGREVLLWL